MHCRTRSCDSLNFVSERPVATRTHFVSQPSLADKSAIHSQVEFPVEQYGNVDLELPETSANLAESLARLTERFEPVGGLAAFDLYRSRGRPIGRLDMVVNRPEFCGDSVS